MRLRQGSRCHLAVIEMCDVAEQLLDANDGIELASEISPLEAITVHRRT